MVVWIAAVIAAASAQVSSEVCAVPNSWIDNSQSWHQLEKLARDGDRQASFQLGLRYELGINVTKDVNKAKRYYDRAAAGRPKRRLVYSPAVGNEGRGRLVDIPGGTRAAEPHARAVLRSSCLRAAKSDR